MCNIRDAASEHCTAQHAVLQSVCARRTSPHTAGNTFAHDPRPHSLILAAKLGGSYGITAGYASSIGKLCITCSRLDHLCRLRLHPAASPSARIPPHTKTPPIIEHCHEKALTRYQSSGQHAGSCRALQVFRYIRTLGIPASPLITFMNLQKKSTDFADQGHPPTCPLAPRRAQRH